MRGRFGFDSSRIAREWVATEFVIRLTPDATRLQRRDASATLRPPKRAIFVAVFGGFGIFALVSPFKMALFGALWRGLARFGGDFRFLPGPPLL